MASAASWERASSRLFDPSGHRKLKFMFHVPEVRLNEHLHAIPTRYALYVGRLDLRVAQGPLSSRGWAHAIHRGHVLRYPLIELALGLRPGAIAAEPFAFDDLDVMRKPSREEQIGQVRPEKEIDRRIRTLGASFVAGEGLRHLKARRRREEVIRAVGIAHERDESELGKSILRSAREDD